MPAPLVSIIIPVYNVENYLEECLNSVLLQTYRNIEIIVINDGSTDNSRNIILRFQEKDKRIVFIDNKNIGLGATRNLGVKKSSGDFVLFVDSDDYIDTKLIEVLVEAINKSDICIYDAVSFQDSTNMILSSKYFVGLSEETLRNEIGANTYREYLFFYISSCLKLYRTGFLKENNIFFPEGKYGEDVLFWLRCLLLTDNIKYVEYMGYYRRYRQNSIMTSGSEKNIRDRVDSVPELFLLTEDYRNLQIKIIIYALENWFTAYKIKSNLLKKHTKSVYDSISLQKRISELNCPLELRLRYFLCKHTNFVVIEIYKFLFYKIYNPVKNLFK